MQDQCAPVDGPADGEEVERSRRLSLVGPANRPIFVQVQGKLNEIADQPAGQYKTQLLVTVSD